MLQQILSSNYANKAFSLLSSVLNYLNIDITKLNNIKIIALTLIISALVIFITLIVVIITCNILGVIKKTFSSSYSDEAPAASTIFSEDEEQELELELQKELELALAQRSELEHKNNKKNTNYAPDNSASNNKFKSHQSSVPSIDFDWQKQKSPAPETTSDTKIDASMLSYHQETPKLYQQISLIIDMIGRDIDDIKIAQTLNYKTQGLDNENNILKLIDAVKCYISLCQSDKLSKVENYNELPKPELSLYHLANNDPSLAIILLENLMDNNINKANNANPVKRQQIFSETSNLACCLGTLAEANDLMLATSVYEMAIELNPNNATAWSRLGDVYAIANSQSKAIWAYQNTYSYADSEINASEIANASRNMSNYLYTQGNTLQATKMHNIAKQYYDSLGINSRFSNKEIDAIKIIENNHKQNIGNTINKLLQRTR